MRPIERKIQDMEVKVIVTTNMVFNIISFLVFGTLIGMMLLKPENIADKPSKHQPRVEMNPKNFLGVD